MTDHSCRFVGKTQPRMLRTHVKGCETPGCSGCEPCPERHCQVCNRTHVTVDGRGTDETCATCIGTTRDHLKGIVDKSTRLLGEAIMRGINSQAAMLEGPAANTEAWGYRRQSALQGRIDDGWLEDCLDEQHPLWVLGEWEILVRQHFEQQPRHVRVKWPDDTIRLEESKGPTITEARAYIDQHLTALAHDGDFAFEELASAVKRCDAHLEEVLREGDRDETGAPCPSCGAPHLVKVYGETKADDRWSCPRCPQWWTEDDYRAKVAGIYVGVASELTAADMADRIRVPASTIRRWASTTTKVSEGHQGDDDQWVEGERTEIPPLLRSCGHDSQGRKLYRVADATAVRDRGDTPATNPPEVDVPSTGT